MQRQALIFGNRNGRLKSAPVSLITFIKKIKKKMINNKKYGVVDIGSNSVRAILYSGGKILYKNVVTTRLGEGLAKTGVICKEALERTVATVKNLVCQLIALGADEILPFATEAVRSASNGKDFTDSVKFNVGFDVDVVSGDAEGELGLLGALNGKDGGIIDIGGASAEIVAASGGKRIYSHSLPLGAVRLFDYCGEDEQELDELIAKRLDEYGEVPEYVDYYAIGGTATTLGFIDTGLEKYDENAVHGRVLTVSRVNEIYFKLRNCSLKERIEVLKVNPKRAEIIVGGAYLLKRIMERYDMPKVTVSEGDNLLGYLKKKIYGESYL